MIWVWQIEMFKNVGTIELPIMEWVTELRFYYGEKKKDDWDLKDIEGKRRNATFIETKQHHIYVNSNIRNYEDEI